MSTGNDPSAAVALDRPLAFDNIGDIPAIDEHGDSSSSQSSPTSDKHKTEQKTHGEPEQTDDTGRLGAEQTGEDKMSDPPALEIAEIKSEVQKVGCSDKELDSVTGDPTQVSTSSATDKVGVTHSLSFPLIRKTKSEESLCDAESESQLSVSQMSNPPNPDPATPHKSKKTKKQKSTKVSKDSRDSDSSVSSRKREPSGRILVKSKFAPGSLQYIEERLCGRIFSGWVEERRWVESVGSYRDVIEVDEWEVEMNQQLKAIISSVPGVYDGKKWINITRKLSGC